MAETTIPTGSGSTGGEVRERAAGQGGQVRDRAQGASGRARDRLRARVDQRSAQAGERAVSTAQDARGVADELRRRGKDGSARVAERAADRIERVGGYLRESSADRILGDVEGFGRRRPSAAGTAI